MDIEFMEIVPGREINRIGPPVIMKVKDISKFSYGIKNAYRTKSPVAFIQVRLEGDAIFIRNADGFTAYFDPDLFEMFKDVGDLYLSNMDVNGNRLLFAKNEDYRYSLAPYMYNDVIEYDK
jgi:hypothetical protein